MEKTKKKGGCLKGIGIFVLIIIGLGILGNIIGEDEEAIDPTIEEPTVAAEETEPETEIEEVEEVEEVVEEEPEPEVELSTEEKINAAVADVIDEERLNEVTITPEGENFVVKVSAEASDNFTKNMIKGGMHIQSLDIVEKLKELPEVQDVYFSWLFPLQDAYGNSSMDEVMYYWFDRETIDKINFDNFSRGNLPNVTNDYFEHYALRN